MRRHGGRLIEDRDAAPLHIGVERLEELRAAAPDVQRKPAPELELAVDLVGLAPEARLQLDALPHRPGRGVAARPHQDFGEIGIAAVLREREQIVEELVFGIGAEIDVLEIFLRERRQHGDEIVDAAEREAEGAAGEMGIAAAFFEGGGFEHQHARAILVRGDRGAQRGIAGPDDEDVGRFARQLYIHGFPNTAPARMCPAAFAGLHCADVTTRQGRCRCPEHVPIG